MNQNLIYDYSIESNNKNHFNNKALINNFDDAESLLEDVNWNFTQDLFTYNELNPFDSRKFIPYPGTFVPEIPFTLVETLTKPNAVILDPFSGSGTTFFQALLLGRKPYAFDVCEVSIEFISALLKLIVSKRNLEKSKLELLKIVTKYSGKEEPRVIGFHENLRPWFSVKTFNELIYLINEKDKVKNSVTEALIHVSILSSLKNLSSQGRGWGCIADNMLPKLSQLKDKSVFKSIISKCNQIVKTINGFSEHIDKLDTSEFKNESKETINGFIRKGDIRKNSLDLKEKVDCVITSPPYPNMSDYITSQRLSYYYLNIDPDKSKFLETGARFKRQRINSIRDYIREMKDINKSISNTLKIDGYICYIMPEFTSDKDKNRLEAINEVMDDFLDYGLEKKGVFERNLPTMRRSHNQKWASLEKEKIYILQKCSSKQ